MRPNGKPEENLLNQVRYKDYVFKMTRKSGTAAECWLHHTSSASQFTLMAYAVSALKETQFPILGQPGFPVPMAFQESLSIDDLYLEET